MSSNQSGEGDIRKSLIEADLVDCMVALPGQLFYSTQIPACLWFLVRDRGGFQTRPYRDRRGQVLFIDARKLGRMVDHTHRELTDEDIARIAGAYHAWRGKSVGAGLVPAPGDHKSRPYPRPLRRRRGAGRRRRAVRGEDEAAHRDAAPAAGRGCEAGCRHCRQFEGVGIWRVNSRY